MKAGMVFSEMSIFYGMDDAKQVCPRWCGREILVHLRDFYEVENGYVCRFVRD